MKKLLALVLGLTLAPELALADTPWSTFINSATDIGAFAGTEKIGLSIGAAQARFGTPTELQTFFAGTSGAKFGLLNGNLTFGGNNTFSGTSTLNGTVSGTGVSALFTSPSAIGSVAPAAGNFTTLGATGNLTTNITGSTQCVSVNATGVLAGAGAVCPTLTSSTSGQIPVYTGATTVAGGTNFTITTGALTLGASGTAGSVAMGNATSGTITLQPVTGALGSVTLSMPAATDTLVGKATTDTLTNKSISGATNTLTAIPNTSVNATPLGTTGTTATLVAPRQYEICTTTCTITLPVPAAGFEFCVMNDDNVATVITLAAIGSSARYENTARTAYGTAGTGTFISGGAVGDRVCLVGRDATHYLTTSSTGSWVAN